MKINAVHIIVEPWTYVNPSSSIPIRKVLKITVKMNSGDLHLEKVIPDDDLISLWDYLWKSAGEELKRAMESEQ